MTLFGAFLPLLKNPIFWKPLCIKTHQIIRNANIFETTSDFDDKPSSTVHKFTTYKNAYREFMTVFVVVATM